MDILEIDAVNFAGRVAHVAAAELFGLLEHGEVRPVDGWLVAGEAVDPDTLSATIDKMAGYVAQRAPVGETLYRAFRPLGGAPWDVQTLAVQSAFELFAVTSARVSSRLLQLQAEEEQRLAASRMAQGRPVDVEDTIFEQEESLHTMRPEALEAAKKIADYDQAQKEERRARRKAAAAKKKAESQAAETPATPAAIPPIGEAPQSKPVNRGGRGNRKAAS